MLWSASEDVLQKLRIVLVTGIVSSIGLVAGASQAQAIQLGVLGAYNNSSASIENNTSSTDTSSKSGFGGGLSLEFGLLPMLSLELDALYLPIGWSTQNSFSSKDTTYHAFQFPLLLRLNPAPLISFGIGPYYQ